MSTGRLGACLVLLMAMVACQKENIQAGEPITKLGRYTFSADHETVELRFKSRSNLLQVELWLNDQKIIDDSTNASTYHRWQAVLDPDQGRLQVNSSDIGSFYYAYRKSGQARWVNDDSLVMPDG